MLADHFNKKWPPVQKRPSNGLPTNPISSISKITIPLDLYRPIIDQVRLKKDQYNLLFVSRVFLPEAERVLYRTILFQSDLNHSIEAQLKLYSFLERTTRCNHVALYVRELKIDAFPSLALNSLQRALRKMRNLRKLILISGSHDRPVLSFSRCRFQLHTLIMYFMGTNDTAFLETQNQLSKLVISRFCNLSLSSDALPALSVLAAAFPGSTYFANHRPLKALYFLEYPSFQLRQPTVRSLRIPISSPPEDFSVIVEAFPALRYLCIEIDSKPIIGPFAQTLFGLLSKLDSLEKLRLGISYDLKWNERDTLSDSAFSTLKNLQLLMIEIRTPPAPCYLEWVRGAGICTVSNTFLHEEWMDPRWR